MQIMMKMHNPYYTAEDLTRHRSLNTKNLTLEELKCPNLILQGYKY